MKAAVPCYNALYKHAPTRLRTKMDLREQQVEQAEQQANEPKGKSQKSKAKSPIQKAISHTFFTKRLVHLFMENMSANDKKNDNNDQ